MLNTGAEYNILPTKTTRTLGCAINKVSTFTISITTRHKFGFAGVARLRIKIAKGIGCEDLFFLVDRAPKTLLRMLFIRRIRLSFAYNKDGSLDGIFIDLEDADSSYTIMVVPLLKSMTGKRVQFWQEL